MTLNIFFSSAQQSKSFYLVLLLLFSRTSPSTMAIILHSKTKFFDEGFGKNFNYPRQTLLLFVGCEFFISIFHFLISLTILQRTGDIEKNRRSVLTYNESIKMTLRRESELEIYHLIVQSILRKKEETTHAIARSWS